MAQQPLSPLDKVSLFVLRIGKPVQWLIIGATIMFGFFLFKDYVRNSMESYFTVKSRSYEDLLKHEIRELNNDLERARSGLQRDDQELLSRLNSLTSDTRDVRAKLTTIEKITSELQNDVNSLQGRIVVLEQGNRPAGAGVERKLYTSMDTARAVSSGRDGTVKKTHCEAAPNGWHFVEGTGVGVAKPGNYERAAGGFANLTGAKVKEETVKVTPEQACVTVWAYTGDARVTQTFEGGFTVIMERNVQDKQSNDPGG
jgi:hypothetical protein